MTQTSTNGHHNGSADPVRFIPLSYDRNDSLTSALRLILAVRPEWDTDESTVESARCTEGITNTLLKFVNKKGAASQDELDKEAVLLRAYGNGTDVLIDRQREAQNHELLMKYGLAPELLARFDNGMLYRYIRGSVTSPADLRKPSIYNAVAKRLAQWHATVPCIPATKSANGHAKHNGANGVNGDDGLQARIDNVAPGKLSPNIWTVMQKWIIALPTDTEPKKELQRKLQKELDALVAELSQRPGLGVDGLVFAHCDLLSGNVIVLPASSDSEAAAAKETPSVSFIDYEYATPSPAAFDIANHFAEWGGFDCDFSVLPTRSQRREFIQEYVRCYFDLLPGAPDVDQAAEAVKLFEEVDLFRGVPGFYWGIWAQIQAIISDIDFDYASYADIRLGEYWAWKAEVDGSRAASGEKMPLREKRWAQAE